MKNIFFNLIRNLKKKFQYYIYKLKSREHLQPTKFIAALGYQKEKHDELFSDDSLLYKQARASGLSEFRTYIISFICIISDISYGFYHLIYMHFRHRKSAPTYNSTWDWV